MDKGEKISEPPNFSSTTLAQYKDKIILHTIRPTRTEADEEEELAYLRVLEDKIKDYRNDNFVRITDANGAVHYKNINYL